MPIQFKNSEMIKQKKNKKKKKRADIRLFFLRDLWRERLNEALAVL